MANKKNHPLLKAIIDLLFVIPNLLGLVNKVAGLISYESRIAGKSLLFLFVFSFVLAIVLTSTWISLLLILFFYLISLQWTSLASMLVVFLINVVALIIIVLLMTNAKNKLLFPMTRGQIERYRRS